VRLILSEFYRIADHPVCIGANLVDLGALTNFWYPFQPREEIIALAESRAARVCCRAILCIEDSRSTCCRTSSRTSQKIVNMLPKFTDEVEALR
jgi:NADH:ubiquinone oxidoreductase subunit D